MEFTDQKYTDESILQEMIDFLEFRKEQMNEPYIVIGEKFVDSLCKHYDSLGEKYRIDVAWKSNLRFVLECNKQ